ncbi:MAG: hypothetical protein WBA62_00300 [Xanthobacteraceae bacterium]
MAAKTAIVDKMAGILVAFVTGRRTIPRRIRQKERPRKTRGPSHADGRKTKAIAIAHLQQTYDGRQFELASTLMMSRSLE